MRTRTIHRMLMPAFAVATAMLLGLPTQALAADVVPAPTISAPAASAVVGPTFILTGRVAAGVTEIRVSGAAHDVAILVPAVDGGATFSVPVTVPYGSTQLTVAAGDGASWSSETPLIVWQLGSTPLADRYVIVDKSDFMLYVVRSGVLVTHYPVAIGMHGTPTPTGTFYLGRPRKPGAGGSVWGPFRMRLYKQRWVKKSYIVHVRGHHVRRWRRVLRLRRTSYYIHGTNAPDSIGTRASHGCVRMWNSNLRIFRTLTYKYQLTIIRE
jgi:lipoprotein-anchoring transpeptidase ErfK/SrfK